MTIESKTPADKEQARKQSAAKREQTRPLRKQIEQLETNNQTIAKQLRQIEQDLTDQGLYDAGRKADLLKLMEQQTNLKLQHAQQEEQLFDLMLALETAETE